MMYKNSVRSDWIFPVVPFSIHQHFLYCSQFHPFFFFCWLEVGLWRQQLKQRSPDIPLPSISFNYLRGMQKRSNQKGRQSLQHVLVCPRGLLSVGHAQNTLPGRPTRTHHYQMPEPPHLGPLYFEPLLNDKASYNLSQGDRFQPLVFETLFFRSLCSWWG